MFQSQFGFSALCDVSGRRFSDVSGACFNPSSGFLPSATPSVSDMTPSAKFQSQFGFSALCDRETLIEYGFDCREFQSQFGFSALCDGCRSRCSRRPTGVSIPVRVFCPLRPSGASSPSRRTTVSIPVRVFCPLRHVVEQGAPTVTFVSIPVRVFCPLRPCENTGPHQRYAEFQSQFGFSALCDRPRRQPEGTDPVVSIPVRVFCPLRPGPDGVQRESVTMGFNPSSGFLPSATSGSCPFPPAIRYCFNPSSGFLPSATFTEPVRKRWRERFQSQFGFSALCDRQSVGFHQPQEAVSIPVRVFCPLRPSKILRAASRTICFNPSSGFLPSATALFSKCPFALAVFQSQFGFSALCDSVALPTGRPT